MSPVCFFKKYKKTIIGDFVHWTSTFTCLIRCGGQWLTSQHSLDFMGKMGNKMKYT